MSPPTCYIVIVRNHPPVEILYEQIFHSSNFPKNGVDSIFSYFSQWFLNFPIDNLYNNLYHSIHYLADSYKHLSLINQLIKISYYLKKSIYYYEYQTIFVNIYIWYTTQYIHTYALIVHINQSTYKDKNFQNGNFWYLDHIFHFIFHYSCFL